MLNWLEDAAMAVAIAIDLGATHLRAAVVDSQGQLLQCMRTDSEANRGPDAAVRQLKEVVASLQIFCHPDALAGVGVALAAIVSADGNRVLLAPNLPRWENVEFQATLNRELKLPVVVGNDCNFGVLGEHRFGAGMGHSHVVYIAIGTGVGAGIIIDNQLLLGPNGLAGEIGHITLDRDGPPCPCGCRGHLEAFVSGKSLARQYTEYLTEAASSLASGKDIFESACNGDARAVQIVHNAGIQLGIGLTDLIHLLNPQVIIIGGAGVRAFDCLVNAARTVIGQHLLMVFHNTFRILPAKLLDYSALYGAASMIFQDTERRAMRARLENPESH